MDNHVLATPQLDDKHPSNRNNSAIMQNSSQGHAKDLEPYEFR